VVHCRFSTPIFNGKNSPHGEMVTRGGVPDHTRRTGHQAPGEEMIENRCRSGQFLVPVANGRASRQSHLCLPQAPHQLVEFGAFIIADGVEIATDERQAHQTAQAVTQSPHLVEAFVLIHDHRRRVDADGAQNAPTTQIDIRRDGDAPMAGEQGFMGQDQDLVGNNRPAGQHRIAEQTIAVRVDRRRAVHIIEAQGIGEILAAGGIHFLEQHDIGTGQTGIGLHFLPGLGYLLAVLDIPGHNCQRVDATRRAGLAQPPVNGNFMGCVAGLQSAAGQDDDCGQHCGRPPATRDNCRLENACHDVKIAQSPFEQRKDRRGQHPGPDQRRGALAPATSRIPHRDNRQRAAGQPWGQCAMIIHQSDDWLVVDKPTGLATHAGKPGELGVVEWLALHLGLETHVVSRLDRGTSGVLLLARNPAAAARAQDIHEEDNATKTYEFLAGQDSRQLGLADIWVRDEPLDDKAARTRFTRLGAGPSGKVFHYRAEISRGRHHQIRRHARLSGLPLLGDEQYGGPEFGRLCLHCAEVRWPEIDGPVTAPQPPGFAALLGQITVPPAVAVCHDRRGKWLSRITDAVRAVHRDEIPGLPAAIDVYGQWFAAVWFDEEATPEEQARLLDPVLAQVGAQYNCRGGVVRTHRRNPHQRRLITDVTVVGDQPPTTFTVHEHGRQYEINLTSTQHAGLFLDQRDTRRRVALHATDARVANLFAYTCSFSVVAAAHGAEVVFSVDTAKPGLNTGKSNFAHNGLSETGQGKFIQEDARKWLARQTRKRDQDPAAWPGWDLIICDPPVFAAAKDGGQFSVAKEWAGLAAGCAGLLAPGGHAVFANNHRTGDHKFYRDALAKVFGTVTSLRPPLDFPVFAGRPQHVRTFWCE